MAKKNMSFKEKLEIFLEFSSENAVRNCYIFIDCPKCNEKSITILTIYKGNDFKEDPVYFCCACRKEISGREVNENYRGVIDFTKNTQVA